MYSHRCSFAAPVAFSIGINCIDSFINADKSSTIIIRAHGEPPETYKYLEKNNLKYIDGTCINVKKIHNLVQSYNLEGYIIVIILGIIGIKKYMFK